MNNKRDSAAVVREFFAAFGQGRLDQLLALFDAHAVIEAVRGGSRTTGKPYGRYQGRDGAQEFLNGLGATFETKEFAVDGVVSDGEIAFASGRFAHVVKATGKVFRSEWALRCVVRGGLIQEYRFYEDSLAFVEAS